MAPKSKRRTALVMNRTALKLYAFKWFARGFGHSGKGFHGESLPPSHQGARSILYAEFLRVFEKEHS